MAGRKKTKWTLTYEALKAKLPENFNGQNFAGTKLNRDRIAKICEEKGYKDKTDDVVAYLKHMKKKSKGGAKKKGKGKKAKVTKKMQTIDLHSKKTYKDMSGEELNSLIAMLNGIQVERAERENGILKKKLAELQAIISKR